MKLMDSKFISYLSTVGLLTTSTESLLRQIYSQVEEEDIKMIGDVVERSLNLSEEEATPAASTRTIFALADFLKFQSTNEEDSIHIYDMAQAIHANFKT